MNNEPSVLNENQQSLDQRYASRPQMRRRLLAIADLIDQAVAQGCTAHEAEARAIPEIRQLGNEALTDWAQKAEEAARLKARQDNPNLILYRKKTVLTWHSTYGEISIEEQRLRDGRRGPQARPFLHQAEIEQRGSSLPLQRVMTDFGAEESFARAEKRLAEHYGIKLGPTAVRECTLSHARAMGAVKHTPPAQPVATLITQMDGSMIPIVQPGEGEDKRKGKAVCWKEVRLCCARPAGMVESIYGATMGSISMAGLVWQETAQAAGLGPQTYVHGLGDGAVCIMNCFKEQFGTQGEYMVDFWHVSEYLGPAGKALAPDSSKEWLHEQQGHLLANEREAVIKLLESNQEPPGEKEGPERERPVASAYQYINERREHLDYAEAKRAELPIGSGEIESGHRHVIQARLKLSGTWWREKTAQWMLQLRVVRANKDWEKYWSEAARN